MKGPSPVLTPIYPARARKKRDLPVRLKDPALCKLFRSESEERLARIERGLARLADSGEDPVVIRAELMREAHTLKGAARMAGLDDVGHLAHCLEDALADAGSRASATRTVQATLAAMRKLTLEATGESAAPLVVTPVATPSAPRPRAPHDEGTIVVESALLDAVLDLSAQALAALHEPAHLGEILPRLHEAARTLRDVPLASLAKPLQRAALETARARGKDVYLLVEDGGVRLPPRAMDALKGALLHVVKNSIDHGIETPAERRAAGKIATGLVTITASADERDVTIEIADDGRGVDMASVLAAAAKRRAPLPTSGRIEDIIFMPGFTTRSDVTETSGRGVGLDAVRTTIEKLGGTVRLDSTPGQGCVVRMRVPLAA